MIDFHNLIERTSSLLAVLALEVERGDMPAVLLLMEDLQRHMMAQALMVGETVRELRAFLGGEA